MMMMNVANSISSCDLVPGDSITVLQMPVCERPTVTGSREKEEIISFPNFYSPLTPRFSGALTVISVTSHAGGWLKIVGLMEDTTGRIMFAPINKLEHHVIRCERKGVVP